RFTSSGSVSRYDGVCLMIPTLAETSGRGCSRLAAGTPIQFSPGSVLHRDVGAAHPTEQPFAVVNPMPVIAAGQSRSVGFAFQPVHGEHLAGLDSDAEEVGPVPPQLAKRVFGDHLSGGEWIQVRPKEQLGTVDVPDARHHGL